MNPTPQPGQTGSLLDPSAWGGWATIVAAVIGAAIIVIGFLVERSRQRKARRAEAYAGALQAVSDYLEAPYRIRRRSGTDTDRVALTNHISEIQSRLDFYEAHLALVGPADVHAAYCRLVAAAKSEAGPQMSAAWRGRPTRRDRDVPGITPYPHPKSDAARREALALMARAQ